MTTTWLRLARPALIVLVASLVSGGTAEAQLVPYDSFAGPKLDADKWRGRQFVTREDGTGALLEIQREVTPVETLILQARAVGGDASDTGLFTAENALQFRHSSKLSDIAVAVVVRSAQVTGCAIGADAAVGARGVYPLFNDGTGDVVAIAEVKRTSSTALEVLASLVHRSAEGDTVLASVSLGEAALNVRVRMRVKWDAANSAVRFQRDAAAAAVLPYANTVVSAAAARKYLGAWTSVPDCTDGTTPTAAIAALFNNVRVNQ